MAFLEVINLTTAESLMEELKPWGKSFAVNEYIFRGHSDASYPLVPSALRVGTQLWHDFTENKAELNKRENSEVFQVLGEFSILAEFYKLADRRGLPVPVADSIRRWMVSDSMLHAALWLKIRQWIPDDLLEVAALAQHYGVPTSLLDWSYDPFTAAYFAAQISKRDKKKPENFCVWALNRSVLSTMSMLDLPLRFVTPHMAGNQNICAQSGLFTLWRRKDLLKETESISELFTQELAGRSPFKQVDRRGLDEHLKEAMEALMKQQGDDTGFDGMFNVFKKFVVPSSEKNNLIQLLNSAGLGASKIFPGYGGCATEVNDNRIPKIRLKPIDDQT
ncbi:FRG domain-containing protein [Paenalcaligenes sp. Me131]|uniref:FRG domain-containing protein n=1 Tax=Paenalcaligenes sp. Me131 TaxID=3392636 RepID=UPI003D27B669